MKIKKSDIAEMVKQEVASLKKEDVTLPANIKRFMDKLTSALKDKGLNRKRQTAILGGVIDSLGIDPSQLMRMVRMSKKGMEVKSRNLPENKENITENKLSKEQMKFAKPIFAAAAKKGGFKIKKMTMYRQPQAEIAVYKYGKDSGSLWSVWGTTFTKSEEMAIKKLIEKTDSDMISGEPSYRPKVKVGTDTEYMDLWVAAQFAGIKYDRDEYDRLFRSKD